MENSRPHSVPPSRVEVITAAWRQIIEALGYDPEDPHLRDSPERVARYLAEWHTFFGTEPPKMTVFPNDPKVDELVLVGDLRFYSVCAHHGLPFFGTAAVGYIPRDSVVGLSKIARVVRHFSRRFQVQERLTSEIAAFLEDQLKPVAVGVVMSGEHLCMSMRGVSQPGHVTTTSDLRGAFRDKDAARHELMAMVMGKRSQQR